jgi:hypothetical protein
MLTVYRPWPAAPDRAPGIGLEPIEWTQVGGRSRWIDPKFFIASA